MTTPLPASPYKGLVPYGEEDAPFFFGRDQEREIITANLMASRLTLLYGTSGVGKTSVLRAGVAYHLREQTKENLLRWSAPEFTVVLFSSWRDDPLEGLLARVRATLVQQDSHLSLEGLPPSRKLPEALLALAEASKGDLFIILDQFEQYFLYHAEKADPEAFASEFPRAVKFTSSTLRREGSAGRGYDFNFLISIREDALAKLDRFKGRIPNLFGNYLRIQHLGREAAREAITRPIDVYNARLRSEQPRFTPEPELVEAVLDQVRTGSVVLENAGWGLPARPGKSGDELGIEAPYLQLVLTKLWQDEIDSGSTILRKKTLDGLGGARSIVQTHLDRVMNHLDSAERDVAARIFRYLVTPTGTKVAYTPADLAALGEANEEQVAAVVAKLSNPETRILRQVEAPAGQPTVSRFEIFHDVLAAAVLAWGAQYRQARSAREAAERAAREAAEQAREAARQRDLEQARALAEERDRRLRLSKRTTWGLSVLTVLSIILAIRACTLTTIARRAEAKAEKNRDEAVKAGEHERDALAREKDERKRANDEEKLAKERLDEALRLLKLTAKDNPKEAYTQTVAAVPALRSERAPEAVEELLEDPRLTIKRKAHDGAVNDMAFGPRGSRLATAGEDGAVQLWEDAEHIDKPRTILQPAGPGRPVCGIAFSRDEDGRYLVAASATGIAILWDLAAGSPPVASFTGHRGPVRDVTFSADGTRLATAGDDGTAKVWDFKTRKVLKTLEGHEGAVLRVYFNRSGDHDPRKEKLFITAGADGMARVWDATTYEPLYVLRHGARINSVTVSADGKRVATAGADRTVKIWDARSSGSLVTAFGRGIHEDEILCVAFSRDDKGRYLATASKDKTARVWDGIDARPLLTLRHDKAVHVIRFSPVATTRSQAKGGRLPEPISSLLLSQPVQSWIVTGSADGFIRVFPVSLGDLRKLDWTQQSRD